MSESCEKPIDLRCSLRQIENRMLLAAEHARGDPGLFQLLRYLAADHGDGLALTRPQAVETAHDCVARHRVQVREGQFLELDADPVAADRAGQRGVDLQRLAGDPLALGRILDEVQRAHVVQPVRKLDQQHPNILGNRKDELAQVLGLPLRARR